MTRVAGRRRALRRLRPLLCVALALPALAALAKSPERMAFSAPVTVEADGRVQVGRIEGVQGKLDAVVREALEGLPYVRGRSRDGQPLASTVLTDGEIEFDREGDEYEVILVDFETQPRLLQWRPADFPVDRLRDKEEGFVSLVLHVAADGSVTGSEVLSSRHPDFTEAARAAAADWRFEPPGEALTVGAGFWFHGNWSYPRAPEIPCTVRARQAHLRGDDGCLRISETTADVVVWGSGGPYTEYVVRPPAPASIGGRRYVPED